MASLDEIEGTALEVVLLLIVGIFAWAAYLAWKGIADFDPAKVAASFLRIIWNAIDSFFEKAIEALTPASGGTGNNFFRDSVSTGTSSMADYPQAESTGSTDGNG